MADEATAIGNAAVSAGKFTEAVEHYTDAIDLDPTNHLLYSYRSRAYASLKQYSEALSDAMKAVHLKLDWSEGYELLGEAHHGLKQYDEAINHYTVAINLDPTNHLFYSCRSRTYASLKQYSEALSDGKKAVHLKPDWSDGHVRLGMAHLGLKQYGEAINHFTIAIDIAPTNHLFYLCRSLAYNPLNQYSAALSDAKKSVHLKPDLSGGYILIGEAHHGLKQYNEAILAYKKGLELDPSNKTLKSGLKDAERAKLRSGRPGMGSSPPKERKRPTDEAELIIVKKKKGEAEVKPIDEEKELKEKKANAQKEKEKGNAAYKKKDFKIAIECYTKAVELDDGDISFLTNRAAMYLEMGKFDECINDCEKAVERGRELCSNSKLVAMALARKGSALVKMAKTSKDYEPVIETFQKALVEHHNPDTLKKLNDAERAKKALEQQEYSDCELAEKEGEHFYMPIGRVKDLMENTETVISISLKHINILSDHSSDIKRKNEKIIADCTELLEDLKQLEAESKLLQQREDELKKSEVELKNQERKITRERIARELLSSSEQLDSESCRKEGEDRKRELCSLDKRKMELEGLVKIQTERKHRASREVRTYLEEKDMDLEKKLKELQSELHEKRVKLQELKNSEKVHILTFNVKDKELRDARLELVDGMKANHPRARIGVKTLDVGKGSGHTVQQLWDNKEKGEASVFEGVRYIIKKFKAEQKQTMN